MGESRSNQHKAPGVGDIERRGKHMNTQYTSKTEAVTEIMQKTGYGRFVIEKRIEKLLGASQIRLLDDPGDRRKQLISRQDVQTIIDSLSLP
jgi:DNA-binding transcriptional regulator GbsR (MarR family)